MAGLTFVLVMAVGTALMWAAMWLLDRLGAPAWFVALPWIVPTVAVGAWVLWRPVPAVLSDDDDESWIGYAIRSVMVGHDTPHSRPVRTVAAVALGAPLGWALTLTLALELTGLA